MSPRGPDRTRLARAVAVAAMIFIVLLAGAGFAHAADPAARLPSSFMPDAFHEGDRGTYAIELRGGWLEADGREPSLSFEHAGHDQTVDAHGRFVEADVVRVTGMAYSRLPAGSGADPWFPYVVEQWLGPDGGRIATRSGDARSSTVAADEVLGTEARETRTQLAWDFATDADRDCLLAPPFGTKLYTDDPGDTVSGCGLLGLHVRLPAGTPLRVVGMPDVDGVRTLAVEAAADGVRVIWHYVPGIPVPLAIEAEAPSLWSQEPRSIQMHLAAFERGQAPPRALAVPDADVPMAMAPLHVWGPEDRDLDHPFPLREAFARAMNDPEWDDLRAWRLDHHNGYVYKTGYAYESNDEGVAYVWTIHLSDGNEGFSFRVMARPADAASRLLGEAFDVTLHGYAQPPGDPAIAPAADRLPRRMPTMGSLWQRWQYQAAPILHDAAPPAYTFSIVSDAHGDAVMLATVGIAADAEWGPAGLRVAGTDVAEAGRSEFSSLLVVQDGTVVRYEEREQTTQEGTSLLEPPALPAQTDEEAIASASAAPRARAVWSLPDPVQSAGLGLAALAVAVLYWAWPLAKGIPGLALFSRIHGDELLEHRTRARIMDAVRQEPGLHFRGLAGRLGVNPGQVRHHVRKLVEGRHLVEVKGTGYTCYYPYKGTPRTLAQAGPVLRAESAQQILATLAARPGASGKDLAAAAGLSPATTNYHLKRLQDAGLVSSQRDGRSLSVHLTSDGRQVAQAMVV